jgi:signal transduction histidine kinase
MATIAGFALLDPAAFFSGVDFPYAIAGLAFAVVGGLIASRQPRNPIGWMFCAFALIVAFDTAAYAIASQLEPDNPGSSLWAWAADIPSTATMGLVLAVWLIFPNGRLPSTRWRPVAWLVGVQMVIGMLAAFLAGGWGGQDASGEDGGGVVSPFSDAVVQAGVVLSNVFFTLMTGLFVIALVAVVLRYRRAVGDERQQMKWFAFAAALLVGALILSFALDAAVGTSADRIGAVVLGLGISAMPVAMGVAILKHRLYDIDVVINKTIVFGALAGFITIVYIAVVVGVGTLLGRGDEPNLALSVAATALVAVAFQPVREQVQHVANRLVYGVRATPYEILSSFSARMGEAADPEELLDRLSRLVAEGTGAQRAQVWLRVGDQLRLAASWPEPAENDPAQLALSSDALPDFAGADRATAVVHHGELLGALAVTKPRGEVVSPTEDKLITDVAAQAGLVLRNLRLTAELLDHVEELRASRQRLVSAQDDERRRLERNLHDGAQQQLVAMKINLSLAKTMAQEEGANDTAGVIAQLSTEADEAVQTLRELAHGIYPPLLASDGLEAALTARTRRSPLSVSVEAEGLVRHAPEVEAAVYFCCLEALQNVIKYAGASTASVRLGERAGALTFSVEDDGCGFDPSATAKGAGTQNMTDRLDALGGSLTITSAPDQGTCVSGHLPVRVRGGLEHAQSS